jgi:hypothetical protein
MSIYAANYDKLVVQKYEKKKKSRPALLLLLLDLQQVASLS